MNTNTNKLDTKHQRQAGFVLTLELMIIMTVLGIGLLVGFIAVRDALFLYFMSEQNKEMYVSDVNDVNIGKSVGFDEHEAPLLVFVDNSQSESYRVLLGVRDDRFTSREPVYFSLPNCQGDPCMKLSSSESVDNQGVDYLFATGAVSYLYALQGGPNYAVGPGTNDRIKGNLYRSSPQACSTGSLLGTGVQVGSVLGSRWNSQKVVSGEPCEPFLLPSTEPTVPETSCVVQNRQDPSACCPAGSVLTGSNNSDFLCVVEGGLVVAESVASPSDPNVNVLDSFQAPFNVNLPVDSNPDNWRYTPPRSENPQ